MRPIDKELLEAVKSGNVEEVRAKIAQGASVAAHGQGYDLLMEVADSMCRTSYSGSMFRAYPVNRDSFSQNQIRYDTLTEVLIQNGAQCYTAKPKRPYLITELLLRFNSSFMHDHDKSQVINCIKLVFNQLREKHEKGTLTSKEYTHIIYNVVLVLTDRKICYDKEGRNLLAQEIKAIKLSESFSKEEHAKLTEIIFQALLDSFAYSHSRHTYLRHDDIDLIKQAAMFDVRFEECDIEPYIRDNCRYLLSNRGNGRKMSEGVILL